MDDISPARWQRVQALLETAFDLPEEGRSAYLDEACADAPELRPVVEALLVAESAAGSLLESPLADVAPGLIAEATGSPPASRLTGRKVGQYHLVEEVGHGGMGSVYLAERSDGQFRQRVAVKLLRHALATDELRARFFTERQILATLNHPNIAHLHDGGVSEDGTPYLVLEYVEGRPLDEYCDARQLSIEARLDLFMAVADAVQYAHRNLIVHRDLKPSNILVSEEGRPKLLDFGIAKLLDGGDLPESAPLTRTGIYLMTPEYASPEQLRGGPVTTATDVYQLGVVLYQLLAGRRPHDLAARSAAEIERIVCHEEPLPPSAAVGGSDASPGGSVTGGRTAEEIARARGTTPQRLRKRLQGDLDTIVLAALRKEPDRRYGSVETLVEDIRRHLAGRPLRARPDSRLYRARKFVRRHPGGVVGAAAAVLAIGVYTVTLTFTAGRLQAERDRARIEAEKAAQVTEFLVDLFEAADPAQARGESLTARELLEAGLAQVERLPIAGGVRAPVLGVMARVYQSLGRYDQALPLAEEALRLQRATLGDGHAGVAESLNQVGEVLRHQGEYDRAEELHREALALRRQLFGEEHPDVATSLTNLGTVLWAKGDLDGAEELHRRALAIYQEVLGDEHTDVARVMNSLGNVLDQKGDFDEAEAFHLQALELWQRLLGEDHPHVAASLNNLGVVTRRKGDLESAEQYYRRALALWQMLLGTEHPYVAASLNNLGVVAARRGDLREAEQLYRQGLELRQRLLGEKHPSVATSLNNLGVVLRRQGEFVRAEEYHLRALALQRELLGDDHPNVAHSLHNLGLTLEERGDLAGAEQYYRDALAMRLELLGEEHPTVAETRESLANVLRMRAEAREVARTGARRIQ